VLALVCGLLLLGLAPVLALLALMDLLRPTRPWARCRAVLAITWIAVCEVVGVFVAFLSWVLFLFHRNSERFLRHNTALQRGWTSALFAGSKRIFGIEVRAEGLEEASQGPIILLVRHASLVDTVLTAAVLANPVRLRLRYVLKDELLNDPCIDIVGNRLPNAFVSRGLDPKEDVARVRGLARALEEDEGALIYPEGTRFSKRKLEKVRARLADNPVLGPFSAELQHVLPPRLGGALALFEEAPTVDVVVLAHTGLEGAATLADFWGGALVGSIVNVRVQRFRAEDMTADDREQPDWLLQRWREVDAWVGEHSQP